MHSVHDAHLLPCAVHCAYRCPRFDSQRTIPFRFSVTSFKTLQVDDVQRFHDCRFGRKPKGMRHHCRGTLIAFTTEMLAA